MPPHNNGTKSRSVRRTYSLPEDIADLFDKEAENRDMHTSTLLLQLMKKWLFLELPLKKIGTITLTEPLFHALLEKIKSDDLEQIAKELSDRNFRSILALFEGDFTLDSIIQSYYQRFAKYSGWYSIKYDAPYNAQTNKLVLYHTHGLNWSKFLTYYNNTILNSLSESMDCFSDNNIVTFTIVSKPTYDIYKKCACRHQS